MNYSRLIKYPYNKAKDIYASVDAAVRDHANYKYISYKEAIINLYRNRNLEYYSYNLSSLEKFKTSDTVFILGSGPSINSLDQSQVCHIKQNDSFGINFSFLFEDLIPTFHSFGWHKKNYSLIKTVFSPFREAYKGVVIFLHTKQLRRLTHPRLTPYLFPVNPVLVCRYTLPRTISIDEPRNFTDEDFESTISYRGSFSLILELVVQMGYKNIVFLGVDLNTNDHFYDDLPQMKIEKESRKEYYKKHFDSGTKFETLYPKPGKNIPMDKYYHSVADYLKRKKGVEVYIGFRDNLLYPKLPAYF